MIGLLNGMSAKETLLVNVGFIADLEKLYFKTRGYGQRQQGQ